MKFEDMLKLEPDKQKEIYNQLTKVRAKGKSTNYSCLPADNTEILTEGGWARFSDVSVGDSVLTYNQDSDSLEWGVIEDKHFYKSAECILMKNRHVSIESTSDHRWFGLQRRKKGSYHSGTVKRFYEPCVKTTGEIKSEFMIINAAHYYGGTRKISKNDAALVGWLLSDGYYRWSDRSESTSCAKGRRKGISASVAQAEHKYWMELERVLDDSEITYHKYETCNNFYKVFNYKFDSKPARNFIDRVVGSRRNKHDVDWVSWILSLNHECLEAFLHSFNLADGTMNNRGSGSIAISQNPGNILDAVTLCGVLLGRRVTTARNRKCQVATMSNRPYTTAMRLTKTVSRNTDVFCLTTNNGSFVIRQNGFITITGNCQYGAGASTIARTAQVDLKVAKKLHAGYWKLNWSIKKIAEMMQVKTLPDGSMWQKNPINGFWYSLRTEKDKFSTLIQGLGSYILDIWLFNVFRLGKKYGLEIKLLGQFHKHHCGFVW